MDPSLDNYCQNYLAEDFKFLIGYSGWAAGQLEAELLEQSWIVSDLSKDVIFDPQIEDKDLWKYAIRGLGGDDSLLANSPFNPYLN